MHSRTSCLISGPFECVLYAWNTLGPGLVLFLFLKTAVLFYFGPIACGILVPQPRIKLSRSALEAWSLNHWTARKRPIHLLIKLKHLLF